MSINLDGVQETMLIPLAIKASETTRNNPRIKDLKAVEIVNKLNLDISKYDKFMSHEGVVSRTILFDNYTKKYVNIYPNATCISIGCGFDARFSRIDNGKLLWYDLDFPDVIEARKKFFEPHERIHLIDKSATDSNWTKDIQKSKHTIIIIEGVLMYFTEQEVKTLLNIIKTNFEHSIIIAELMPPFAVKGAKHHDTVKNMNATFKWGVESGKDVEALCEGLKLLEEKSFNCEMKKHSVRGLLFATLPFTKNLNDRIAIFSL